MAVGRIYDIQWEMLLNLAMKKKMKIYFSESVCVCSALKWRNCKMYTFVNLDITHTHSKYIVEKEIEKKENILMDISTYFRSLAS